MLGFAKAHVVASPVTAALSRPPAAPYDVVFLDPPYPLDEAAVGGDLALLAQQGWLVPGAMVVVERSSRSPEPDLAGRHRPGTRSEALRRDHALVRSRRRRGPRTRTTRSDG